MKRRSFLSSAGLIVVGTASGGSLLAACGSDEKTAAGGTEITFITPFQHIMSYIDVYVALQEGFFKDEGLAVNVIGGTGTASSVSQIVAGQGQIGKAAAVVTCPLVGDKGAEIITVAQGDARSQYSVASSPDKPLLHPSDWQGKTIGVISKGGSTELLLDAMSVAEGLDPTKVNKVVTGADIASLEFLKRGEVQGFITFLGSETTLREMKVDLHYLNTDDFAKMPGDSYFVPKAQLDQHPDQIASFVRSCRKAYHFMEDESNTDAVLAAVGKFNPTEVSDKALATAKLRAQVALCKPTEGDFLDLQIPTWESAIDLMRKSGILQDKSHTTNDFVTTAVLEKL